MDMIRQPIIVTVGHIDAGKTSLLDRIRGTTVADKEAGAITQHFGASEIPAETISKTCDAIIKKMNLNIEVPGLLILDTPGHAAFTAIRKRGSSIADLAILVIDINEGIQEQTEESIRILREFKTPFVVAATKIDRIAGWRAYENGLSIESYEKQQERIKDEFDKRLYTIVAQLSERGFNADRYDRVSDFKNTIAVIPCSSVTGEGIQELLAMLTGLAQSFLKKDLEIKPGEGRGSILEVKDVRGLGTTIDVILYDGEVKKGDWLIIGGRNPIVTKIKALLKPPPLKELRIEKQFKSVDAVSAAAGVKISALNVEGAVAGSPIITVDREEKVEGAKREVQSEVESIEIEQGGEGVVVKADTLGSLEAIIGMLKERSIPIKKASVGLITRRDMTETETSTDSLNRALIVFNSPVEEGIVNECKDKKIKLISNNIIYRLFEEYDSYVKGEKEKLIVEKLNSIQRPAKIVIIPGNVFRNNDPAIVGVEVLDGILISGAMLQKGGKEIGEVKAIQTEGVTKEKAEKGEKVAVSISGPTVGRHIFEDDELYTIISRNDLKVLEDLERWDEVKLAKKILGEE